MYTPSFLEIFVAWCVVVFWASWLGARVAEAGAVRAVAVLPWVTGVAVILGQLGALLGLLQSGDNGNTTAATLIHNASFGSAGVVVLALVMELLLTALVLVRRKQG